ncbi:MAG: hypothetical protein DRR06_00540 [Gammaproteobacteria bacterium]|nr:MAG: hypothetical protein DRQ54_05690 [Gammaproteobacteria bacterium]RLA48069.1 MAG: hypothetical protein DRR06_00540 [Gammaproteobacteria bacterium]
MERVYSEDDKICFNNINTEMAMLAEYLADCNARKYSLFKLSLVVSSVVVTALMTIFKLYSEDGGITIKAPFNYIFGAILVLIGLINIVIIKELLSIHASRLITYRQMNCFRQALDSIKYRKFEGCYPDSVDCLKSSDTEYWNILGKHRKLPLDNEGLVLSERGLFRSPDKFMIFILALISALVIFSPVIYMAWSPDSTYREGLYSGLVGMLFVAGFFVQFRDSRKRLRAQLKFGKTPETSFVNTDTIPPVS